MWDNRGEQMWEVGLWSLKMWEVGFSKCYDTPPPMSCGILQCIIYLIHVLECIKHIIWQTGQQVDHEPALQIIHSNDLRIRYDLAAIADERRMEVQYDIDEENDVDDAIDNQ